MCLLFAVFILFQALIVRVIVVDYQQAVVVFYKRVVPKGEVHVFSCRFGLLEFMQCFFIVV